LYISEGNLLPSKTEMSLAHKAHFDLYTLTNLSVLEIAEYLDIKPHVIAIAKHNLSNRDEEVAEFRENKWFASDSRLT
jgi:DNA-binding CsgD family transcriptional regulator